MRSNLVVRLGWLTIVCGLLLFLTIPGLTQENGQIGNLKETGGPFDKYSKRRSELMGGEKEAETTDTAVAVATADFYTFRITWKSLDYAKVQRDYETAINGVTAKTDRKFFDLYGKALANSMKRVLDRDLKVDPTTLINACMMLPTLAKYKQVKKDEYIRSKDIVDLLASLADGEKTNDVVRLYAYKALKECMPVREQPETDDTDLKERMARRKLEAKCVDALVKSIERPFKVDNMTREEDAVVHYLRREAITALAQAGAPAVWVVAKEKGKIKPGVEGAVAPTLLKVLATPGLIPPANLQEKIEAALGLCAMKYTYMPEYNSEIALYLVGKTLLEFTDEYSKDLFEFGGKGPNRKLARIAWKTDANRFINAGLPQLVASAVAAESAATDPKVKGNLKQVKTNANELKRLASPILNSMASPKGYLPPNREHVTALAEFVTQKLLPKTDKVWRTLPCERIPLK